MKNIITQLKKAKNIAIFTHVNADPDALGSVGALSHALGTLGKHCDIFLNEKPTWKFDFLSLQNVKEEFSNSYDLFVALDVSDTKRLGVFEEGFLAQQNTICIDHHIMRNVTAKTEYVDANCSSTCEILFDLFGELKIKMNAAIAGCLYCGLIGDTGGFMFSNTTSKTHMIAADLISYGADINLINKNSNIY